MQDENRIRRGNLTYNFVRLVPLGGAKNHVLMGAAKANLWSGQGRVCATFHHSSRARFGLKIGANLTAVAGKNFNCSGVNFLTRERGTTCKIVPFHSADLRLRFGKIVGWKYLEFGAQAGRKLTYGGVRSVPLRRSNHVLTGVRELSYGSVRVDFQPQFYRQLGAQFSLKIGAKLTAKPPVPLPFSGAS